MEYHTENDENKKEDLIIFSNGPGEISTWVLPFVERVKNDIELYSRYRIILIIHPCQFGSGTEYRFAGNLELFDLVITPKRYLLLIFMGIGKRRYNFRRKGILISLGGDLVHPVLFKKRVRGNFRLFAYTNNPSHYRNYERIFVRNDWVKTKALRLGIPGERITVVGDLVYSSLKWNHTREETRKMLSLKVNERMVLFMPGSRDFELRYMLPVYLKVMADLAKRFNNLKFFILKSPYVDYNLFEKALDYAGQIQEVSVLKGTLVHKTKLLFPYVKSEEGMKIPVLEDGLEKWGSAVDLAVTIPGTNTIQLAYRRIPAIVVAALNKPELIPIEGFLGILKWIPLGKYILKRAVERYVKNFSYAALPNIYTNREIFPELFGVISTDDITDRITSLLEHEELKTIKKRLSTLRLTGDPAQMILEHIWEK